MQPDEILRWMAQNINEMIHADDASHRAVFWDEVQDAVNNLGTWLARGGFKPEARVNLVNRGNVVMTAEAFALLGSPEVEGVVVPYPNTITPGKAVESS